MKLEYNLINGRTDLDKSLYLFVGPKISEIGDTISASNYKSLYAGYGTLNIPNGVKTLNAGAFINCSGFNSVIIPESITSINYTAFQGCDNITDIIWNVKTYDNLGSGSYNPFYNILNKIKTFTIGETVLKIPQYMCTGMIALNNIIIPSSVNEISQGAFGDCSGLDSITCLNVTPPVLGLYAFENTNNCPIYVPAESVDTYKAASGWSTYASRIQPINS